MTQSELGSLESLVEYLTSIGATKPHASGSSEELPKIVASYAAKLRRCGVPPDLELGNSKITRHHLWGYLIFKHDKKPAVELAAEKDLSTFSRWQRTEAGKFMTAECTVIVERADKGLSQSIEEKSYTFHVHSRSEGVCAIMISDQEYKDRVAIALLKKVLDDFLTKHPRTSFSDDNPGTIPFPELKEYLTMSQDPKNDTITKLTAELDETIKVLHKVVDDFTGRGAKLDALVHESGKLSEQSKMFYIKAKKQNSCCVVM